MEVHLIQFRARDIHLHFDDVGVDAIYRGAEGLVEHAATAVHGRKGARPSTNPCFSVGARPLNDR